MTNTTVRLKVNMTFRRKDTLKVRPNAPIIVGLKDKTTVRLKG